MEKKTTTKKAATKPVKEVKPVDAPVQEKPTYEQLDNYAKQLSIQAQRMAARIQDLEMLVDSKRLDYLFKVIENPLSFDEAFINHCTEEIVNALTPQQEEKGE